MLFFHYLIAFLFVFQPSWGGEVHNVFLFWQSSSENEQHPSKSFLFIKKNRR